MREDEKKGEWAMTTWTVRVDFSRPDFAPTDDWLDQVTDDLTPVGGAMSIDRTGSDHLTRLSAFVTSSGETVREAAETAMADCEKATGMTVVGLEVLTAEEHDRREATPRVPDLVSSSEIARMAGLSRQRIRQLETKADFPPAVAEVNGGQLRLRSQVEAWLKQRNRKPGRPASVVALATNDGSD